MKMLRLLLIAAMALAAQSALGGKPNSYTQWYTDYSGKRLCSAVTGEGWTTTYFYDDIAYPAASSSVFWAKKDNLWSLRAADNSGIIPFRFEEVRVNPYHLNPDSMTVEVEAVYAYDGSNSLPSARRTVSVRHFPLRPYCLALFPVKENGKWGYVNARGETVIPFVYDEAYAYHCYCPSDRNRRRWLAAVEEGSKSHYIDIYGRNYESKKSDLWSDLYLWDFWGNMKDNVHKKSKQHMGKHKKGDYERQLDYERDLDGMLEGIRTASYKDTFDGTFSVETLKPVAKRQKASRGSNKKKRRQAVAAKAPAAPVKYRIAFGAKPHVVDSLEYVFERQGDFVRFKDDGRFFLLNLANLDLEMGDTIGPFNEKGLATIVNGGFPGTINKFMAIRYDDPAGIGGIFDAADAGISNDDREAFSEAYSELLNIANPDGASNDMLMMNSFELRSLIFKYNNHFNPKPAEPDALEQLAGVLIEAADQISALTNKTSGSSATDSGGTPAVAGGEAYAEDSGDGGGGSSSSSAKKKSTRKVNNYDTRGFYRAMDAIIDNLTDRKNNPERYSHESKEQFRSEVRRAQSKARKLIDDFKRNTGGNYDLPNGLLRWNP